MSNKKSFVLYYDMYPPISALTLEQKGAILDALFTGENIVDPVANMAFTFIKTLDKYQ